MAAFRRTTLIIIPLLLVFMSLSLSIQASAPIPPPVLTGEPDIVGGVEAVPGAWPWMAALVDAGEPDAYWGQFCGGALIRPNWVLTAAHCTEDVSAGQIDVVLGRHNLSSSSGERLDVAAIIRHPNYNSNTLNNDLALLRLSSNSTQTPIQFVRPGDEGLFSAGTLSTVIGWGATSESGYNYPDGLRQVSVPIVSGATCQSAYGSDITNNMLCAGYASGGKDSCFGDSGGPLMVPDGSSWLHAGIVSWGDGCARPNAYGVYTRVGNYYSWITSYVGSDDPTPTPTATGTPTPTATTTATATNTPTATYTPDPQDTNIRITQQAQTVLLNNGEICLDVQAGNVTNLGGFEFELHFPPSLLHATSASLGNFLGSTGRTPIPLGPQIDNSNGAISYGAASLGLQSGPQGSGTLAQVCFIPQSTGEASLTFNSGQLTSIWGAPLSASHSGASVTISDCQQADLDCDGDVDIVDIQLVAGRWGAQSGDPNYIPHYDLDSDGDIDITDIQMVASQWGWPQAASQSWDTFSDHTVLTLSFAMDGLRLSPGQSVFIPLRVTDAQGLGAFEVHFSFDPALLKVENISLSAFLESSGRSAIPVGPEIDNQTGVVHFGAATFGSAPGVSGEAIIAWVELTSLAAGQGTLDLYGSQATTAGASNLPVIEIDSLFESYYWAFLPVTIR